MTTTTTTYQGPPAAVKRILFLLALSFTVFHPVFRNDFAFDDRPAILENADVNQ